MKRFSEMASLVELWLFAIILFILSVLFGPNLFSVFSAVSALYPFRESPPPLPHLELEKIISAYVAILVPFLFLIQIADKLVEKTNEARTLARASLIAISSLVAISFIVVPQVASINLANVANFADFLLTLAIVIILVSPYFYSVRRIIGLILKYESKES
jgi:hypothetical protein